MYVTSLGRGPGSVATLPDPRASRVAVAPAPPVGREADVARLGWFDVNDDGHIDNKSVVTGGDGTLIVSSDVHVPDYAREARHHDAGGVEGASRGAGTASAAQARHAIDAYQRYGDPSERATADAAEA
jgi:hypothetical protein